MDLGGLKDYLRITGDREDGLLLDFLEASEEALEQYLQTSFLRETWVLRLNAPPIINKSLMRERRMSSSREYSNISYDGSSGYSYAYTSNTIPESIVVPIGNVASIDSITVYKDDNSSEVIDSSNYVLNNATLVGEIIFKKGFVWPSDLRLVSGVEIQFQSGYATRDEIPSLIKATIYHLTGFKWNNRGSTEDLLGQEVTIMKEADPFKLWGFHYGYP